MKFNLRSPCKNCPFGDKPTRIVFSCRERAEEIEELAYRRGFPCHLSATLDEDAEEAGYEFGPETQHCVGAIGMFLNDGYDTWPGIDNRTIRADYTKAQAAAFESCEAFFEANERDSRHSPNGRDRNGLGAEPEWRGDAEGGNRPTLGGQEAAKL